MRPALILPLTLLLGACPPLDDAPTSSAPAPLAPIAAGDLVLTADPDDDALVAVQVLDGDVVAIRRVALSGPPSRLAVLPDDSAALSLNRATETLDRIDVAGLGVTRYELGAPFEALAMAPDATAAVAYFPPGSATTVFHNANEIAVVDLRAETPPGEAVVRRTVASLGAAPRAVHPSPLVDGHRYAFVLSDDHVAVLDLADPLVRERSVPLVSLNTGGQRTPVDVDFAVAPSAADGDVLWAVVTVAEDNAVYALRVSDTVPDGPGEPPFDVRLSQLAGYGPGGEVTLVTLPNGDLVTVILSPSAGAATITRLTDGFAQTVPLGAGVDRMRTYFEGDRPIVVAFRRGGAAFHVLDVAAVGERGDRAARTRFAAQGIEELMPIPGTPLFFAFHAETLADNVSVINADTDRITTFGRTGRVRDVALRQELGRLYLLTSLGADDFLVSVQLDNLHPESSPVAGGADRLLVLPAADTVATAADVTGGQLTLWPATLTIQDVAVTLPAYLLDGLLDRAGE